MVEGCGGCGIRVSGFRVLGFRVLGFWGLGFWGLGFWGFRQARQFEGSGQKLET